MISTISNDKNKFFITTEDMRTGDLTSEDFFTEGLGSILAAGGEVYMDNLRLYGMPLIHAIRTQYHYVDMTQNRLDDGKRKKPDKGTYTYILSADNGAFYQIWITNEKNVTTKIFEFKNLVAVDDITLQRDFGGAVKSESMMLAIKSFRDLGMKGSTLSSCSYSYWKKGFDRGDFSCMFPEPQKTMKFFRDAYHGGICYVNDGKHQKVFHNGITLDANSLYSYIMKTARFPYGPGRHGTGKPLDELLNNDDYIVFLRFRAAFKVKENYVPFARTRCDEFHTQFEYLTTSNMKNEFDEETSEWVDEWGEIHPLMVEFCMHECEYKLFLEHYDIYDIEYLEYHFFPACHGVFDNYVNQFYNMKKNAQTPAERRIAKMFLNGLTGRMGLIKERRGAYFDRKSWEMFDKKYSSIHRVTSVAGRGAENFVGDLGNVDFFAGVVETESRSMTHPQVAATITSEAMVYIIKKAQKNFDHFLYTDTDSLHMDCRPEDLVDINISDELGDFKVEHDWNSAIFYQPKKYVLADKKDGVVVKFAGVPQEAERLLEVFLTWKVNEDDFMERYKFADWEENPFIQEEKPEFLQEKPDNVSDLAWDIFLKSGADCHLSDFYGLKIPYTTYEIESLKTYRMREKINWYCIDLWSR